MQKFIYNSWPKLQNIILGDKSIIQIATTLAAQE